MLTTQYTAIFTAVKNDNFQFKFLKIFLFCSTLAVVAANLTSLTVVTANLTTLAAVVANLTTLAAVVANLCHSAAKCWLQYPTFLQLSGNRIKMLP